MTRPLRLLTVVLLISLVLGAFAAARWGRDRLPEDAVFRFPDQTYLRSDLDEYLNEQKALYGAELPHVADDDVRRLAAHSFALSLVVDDAARRAEISVSEAELIQAQEQFVARSFPQGRDGFVNALADEGVSERDVVDELRRQLTIEKFYAEVTAGVTVDDVEVRTAYQDNPEQFQVPQTRLVSEIVLRSPNAARALKEQLDPGSFAATARRVSLDSTTADEGGSLGYVARAQLQGRFGRAAYSARPGVVFGPVRAQGADYVYLGLVRDVRPGHTQPFKEVRERLAEMLRAARALERWQAFLVGELARADVEYADDYRPQAPDTLPSGDVGTVTDPDGPTQGRVGP